MKFVHKKYMVIVSLLMLSLLFTTPTVSAAACDWIPFWSCTGGGKTIEAQSVLRLTKYQGLEKYIYHNVSATLNETHALIEIDVNVARWNWMLDAINNPTMAKCRQAERIIKEDYPKFTCNKASHRNLLMKKFKAFRDNGLKMIKNGKKYGYFKKVGNKVYITLEKDKLGKFAQLHFGENSIHYDYLGNNLVIKDSNNTVLQDITLIKNSDNCLTDCYAEGQTILYQNEKLFEGYDFVNRNNKTVSLNNVTILLGTLEEYQINTTTWDLNCTTEDRGNGTQEYCGPAFINGSIITNHTRWNWEEYNFSNLSAGTYKWRIEAHKAPGESLDWAISLQGFETSVIRQYWAWWNSAWKYKRQLSNLTGEYPTLNISWETGKMNANFSDLRFLDSSETTELNYTIRDWKNASWVYVTIDTNNVSNVYMYYGNENATTTSSPNNTFFHPIYYSPYDTSEDDLISGIDATNNGATLVNNGSVGSAFDFERTEADYIQIPDNAILDLTDNVTFAVWIRPESSGWGAILGKTDNNIASHISYLLRQTNTNTIIFNAYDGITNRGCETANAINVSEWTFLTVRFSNGTCIFSFNSINQTIASNNMPNNFIPNNFPLHIGVEGYITPANLFDGIIDELFIYDKVLTSEEINEIYSMAEQTNTYTLGPESTSFNIVLNHPEDDYKSYNGSVDFNCSAEDKLGATELNMTFDEQVVAQVTNTSQFENLTATYTNNSIPDGIYQWNCRATSVNGTLYTSSNYTLNVDSNAPVVNLTAPVNGTIIYQPNESIQVNWTVSDFNLSNCSISTDSYLDRDTFETGNDSWQIVYLNSGTWGQSSNWSSEGNYSMYLEGGCALGCSNTTINKSYNYSGKILVDVNISSQGSGAGNAARIYVNGSQVWGNNTNGVVNDVEVDYIAGQEIQLFAKTEAKVYYDNIRIVYEENVNCSSNTTTIYFPETNPDNMTITFSATDWFNYTSTDNTTVYKSTTSPNVTITSPTTVYNTLSQGDSIDLNFTITNTTNLDTCWYEYNNTNTTISCFVNTAFSYELNYDTLNLYSNDSFGNVGSDTVTWIILAVTKDVIYESSVIETDQTTFTGIFNTTGGATTVTGTLVYDGTSYAAVPTVGTDETNLTRTIDVPLVDVDENKTFFFNITIVTANFTGTTNTPENNQTVYNLELTRCNETDPQAIINYTTRVARSPFDLLDTTFASAWFYYLVNGTGNVIQNFSYEDTSENESNYTFCLNFNETIVVNNQIEIEATGYVPSNNFLVEANLSNVNITSQTIYLLNSSLADATVLQVYDQSGFPIGNVLINIQYYDIGSNSFITVTQALTSSLGSDVVYINWLDSLYKFVLIQGGETVQTTLPENIFESPRIFTLGEEISFTFEEFQGTDYNIYYDNTTTSFYLTFSKPTGAFTEGCLRVEKRSPSADEVICDTCSTATSATLLCNIGAEGNGTFVATFYGLGSYSGVDWIIEVIGKNFSQHISNALSNDDKTFYAFMLGLIIVGVMFVSPIAGILAILLSVFIGNVLGFVLIDFLTFMGLSVMGGVIAWLIRS